MGLASFNRARRIAADARTATAIPEATIPPAKLDLVPPGKEKPDGEKAPAAPELVKIAEAIVDGAASIDAGEPATASGAKGEPSAPAATETAQGEPT